MEGADRVRGGDVVHHGLKRSNIRRIMHVGDDAVPPPHIMTDSAQDSAARVEVEMMRR